MPYLLLLKKGAKFEIVVVEQNQNKQFQPLITNNWHAKSTGFLL